MNEFDLIGVFVRQFDVAPSPRGPGDDCAVLPRQGPSCVTTDAVVEGVHFTRRTFSFEDIGHKALAVNLSDLAAMGARPSWFTVALGLPDDVMAKDLAHLGRGMSALARTHGIELVGGNVTRSLQLSLTLTLCGALEGAPMLRSGARPGDALYVSGPLGEASAGLVHHALSDAQRRPTPHVAFAQFARRFSSAAIDVSDGLAQDLGHVCKASGVGANVWTDALPLSERLLAEVSSREVALEFALRGGEDYVLLLAVPGAARFEAAAAREGFEVHRIGEFVEGKGVRVDGERLAGKHGFTHR